MLEILKEIIMPRKRNRNEFKPCNGCEHYSIQESENEGLIRVNCSKYGMSTEIKSYKIMHCPIGHDGQPIYYADNPLVCPICGYPIGIYRDEETGTLTGRCAVCGYEQKERGTA